MPCKFVLHTVGPVISGRVTKADCELLASCYRSCLEFTEQKGVKSIALCCISTGEFHFSNDLAAEIAVETVKQYRGNMEMIFNVFKDVDYEIYRDLLGKWENVKRLKEALDAADAVVIGAGAGLSASAGYLL